MYNLAESVWCYVIHFGQDPVTSHKNRPCGLRKGQVEMVAGFRPMLFMIDWDHASSMGKSATDSESNNVVVNSHGAEGNQKGGEIIIPCPYTHTHTQDSGHHPKKQRVKMYSANLSIQINKCHVTP